LPLILCFDGYQTFSQVDFTSLLVYVSLGNSFSVKYQALLQFA